MTRLPLPSGYILALYGPSGVGKSTVSRLLLSMLPEQVVSAPILTTRGPKAGDEGEYVHVTAGEFAALRERGEIVAATQIPSSTEQRWYGYRGGDIEGAWQRNRIPVVITEIHLLRQLAERYGRRAILSFGLLPPGESRRAMLSHLLHRLRVRGRETEAQIAERLQNAEDDLRRVEEHPHLFTRVLVNDHLPAVVETFRDHLLSLPHAPLSWTE